MLRLISLEFLMCDAGQEAGEEKEETQMHNSPLPLTLLYFCPSEISAND